MNFFRKLFKKEEKQEYFDMRELLEHVQSSDDWKCASFIEPKVDVDNDLIYINEETNLAFKFIIDEKTNTVGMKKVNPDELEVKQNSKTK